MIHLILFSIILPIFILIAIGMLFEKAFHPDMDTLSKLNFYILVPAIVFIKMIETELDASLLLVIGIFATIHFFTVFACSFFIFSLKRFREKRIVLSLGSSFSNSGNYGIPFTLFAFGDAFIDIIAVIMIMQNIIMFSFGIWLMERGRGTWKEVLKRFSKIPVIYAVIAGLFLRWFEIDLIPQVKDPLTYLADAVIAIALITLGAKLARSKVKEHLVHPLLSTGVRLILSPLIAVPLVLLFDFSNQVNAMLIVTAGLPTAVNTYILAQQYKKNEDVASQSIFWSTLLSAISLTVLLVIFVDTTTLA